MGSCDRRSQGDAEAAQPPEDGARLAADGGDQNRAEMGAIVRKGAIVAAGPYVPLGDGDRGPSGRRGGDAIAYSRPVRVRF